MPVPVISTAQMREWEQATWAAGRNEQDVIRRVGHILAARIHRLTRPGDLVVVLAGKGHNGDDARLASQNLADREVRLINVNDPAEGAVELRGELSLQPALLVDGLFGIGLNRPLDAAWVKFIAEINDSGVPIMAVDVPSGLDADSGLVLGGAIKACVTVTLGAPKQGLLKASAWAPVGRLEVAPDIGLVPHALKADLQWVLPADFKDFPPSRPVSTHKGTFGHVAVIAGSMGFHGAAVLCAQGALRANPGLVSVFCAANVYTPVASQLQAAMVHPWDGGKLNLPESCTAIVAGPGLADPTLPNDLREIRQLWDQSPLPMVVDASALDCLQNRPIRSKAIRVVTPHPGEASRLLKTGSAEVQQDRPDALRAISEQLGGCWVVLKGHQTIVGRSEGQLSVNSSGNPLLAQGGSGDILAGYLAGLLAQPELQKDPGRATRYAVWQHGAAADLLSSRQCAWGVTDLLTVLGNSRPEPS